ncbi:hypothetical protein T12_12844 [Trichinella patagoniensis]|uniref:Uncharacterized protein n=1 Tax=Trichinella patagoniensis TaxID=990121 RepID=A0A0V1AEC6_9BILA|nr:hypothetical protein T12_12844 [Trichinella patagoniensis]
MGIIRRERRAEEGRRRQLKDVGGRSCQNDLTGVISRMKGTISGHSDSFKGGS